MTNYHLIDRATLIPAIKREAIGWLEDGAYSAGDVDMPLHEVLSIVQHHWAIGIMASHSGVLKDAAKAAVMHRNTLAKMLKDKP